MTNVIDTLTHRDSARLSVERKVGDVGDTVDGQDTGGTPLQLTRGQEPQGDGVLVYGRQVVHADRDRYCINKCVSRNMSIDYCVGISS